MKDFGDKLVIEKRILDWVNRSPGEFSDSLVDRDLCFKTSDEKLLRTDILEGFVTSGVLARVGNRRGVYRKKEDSLKRQDVRYITGEPVDLWMPFNLTNGPDRLVKIFNSTIITIGGEKERGKTCFNMNIAFANRDKWVVHYFNSEMSDEELKVRQTAFGHTSDEWDKVNFYERSRDFADVIHKGERDLNIIDFLEVTDEFWKIGNLVREIFDAMGRSVVIISVQKKTGAEHTRGGEVLKEKSRLHIDLEQCEDKDYRSRMVVKTGKIWARKDPKTGRGVNPRGLYVKYKISDGSHIYPAYNSSGGIWFKDE